MQTDTYDMRPHWVQVSSTGCFIPGPCHAAQAITEHQEKRGPFELSHVLLRKDDDEFRKGMAKLLKAWLWEVCVCVCVRSLTVTPQPPSPSLPLPAPCRAPRRGPRPPSRPPPDLAPCSGPRPQVPGAFSGAFSDGLPDLQKLLFPREKAKKKAIQQ